jgi:hypothetical protein
MCCRGCNGSRRASYRNESSQQDGIRRAGSPSTTGIVRQNNSVRRQLPSWQHEETFHWLVGYPSRQQQPAKNQRFVTTIEDIKRTGW